MEGLRRIADGVRLTQ